MMQQREGISKIQKILYGKNQWAGVPFIQIPYYIWVGIPTVKGAKISTAKEESLKRFPSLDYGEEKKFTDDEVRGEFLFQ
jgi:hypothetical protein